MFVPIPQHDPTDDCEYLANGFCYWCCSTCDADRHTCHFCGDPLDHHSRLMDGSPNPCYMDTP